MVCIKCGEPVSDHAKFCEHCGTQLLGIDDAPPSAGPVPVPTIPTSSKKKKSSGSTGLCIGILVVVILLVFFSCVGSASKDNKSERDVFIEKFCDVSGLSGEIVQDIYDLVTDDLEFSHVEFLDKSKVGDINWEILADGITLNVTADDDGIYRVFIPYTCTFFADGEIVSTKNTFESNSTQTQSGSVSDNSSVSGTVSINSAISLIRSTMEESFDNVTVYHEDGIIYVNIWTDGASVGAILAAAGDEECLAAWNLLVANQEKLCKNMCELVKSLGIEDTSVVLSVLNDTNLDNVLLTVMNGYTVYDAVNDE